MNYSKVATFNLARWEGTKDGLRSWSSKPVYCWLAVYSLTCLSEKDGARLGSCVIIDVYNAQFSDSSDSAAFAEMVLILQMGTCGQFENRGDASLISVPVVLLRLVYLTVIC